MDKNVGSVDLDELKKAREELNRDRGIETDPHMYDNYNPNRAKEENESAESSLDFDAENNSSNDENDSQTEQTGNDSNNGEGMTSSEKNFDVYDSFSDFEVKENADKPMSEPIKTDANKEEHEENLEEKHEENLEEKPAEDASFDELESFLDNMLDGENDDEFVVDSLTDDTDNYDPNKEDNSKETQKNDNELDLSLDDLNFDDNKTEKTENNKEPEAIVENSKTESDLTDDSFSAFKAFEVEENASLKDEDSSIEVISNFKKLNEMLEEDDKKAEELEKLAEEEIKEKNRKRFDEINDFEFIETITTGEFKNADNLSFVLGKDENEKLVFANLRDIYNTAIFGTDKEKIFEQLSTIILSLSLKNNTEEIDFVICDSKAATKFDVFNDSSFMYFNRVAKTNKEIIETLVELSKELEERYKKLVQFGAKSIESYNMIAKENDLKPMPYILTIFGNYTKASQLANANRINSSLINIVKLGRLVGMYLMINADFEISNAELNVNLPTRITYKSQTDEDSISAIGEVGAEYLPEDGNILYYNIYDRAPKHLKIPKITLDEIKLIIENIEN